MSVTKISYHSNNEIVTFNVGEYVVMYRYKSSVNVFSWGSMYGIFDIQCNESFKFFKI